MIKTFKVRWFTALLFLPIFLSAQDDLYQHIYLDSTITVVARRTINIKDIIEVCMSDESLYKAFQNLRRNSFEFESDFVAQGKKKSINYHANCHQYYIEHCRFMEFKDESVKGRLFKKGNKRASRFHTFSLLEKLFYTKDSICGEVFTNGIPPDDQIKGSWATYEKQSHELKKLIFQPGRSSNIPFIGAKTEIFSSEMRPYYNYTLRAESEYYFFDITLKDEYKFKNSKTVIKYFSTKFKKLDFQVLERNYKLAYHSPLYKFDVTMNIELELKSNAYITSSILYDGFWKVPLKKKEQCTFELKFKHN